MEIIDEILLTPDFECSGDTVLYQEVKLIAEDNGENKLFTEKLMKIYLTDKNNNVPKIKLNSSLILPEMSPGTGSKFEWTKNYNHSIFNERQVRKFKFLLERSAGQAKTVS